MAPSTGVELSTTLSAIYALEERRVSSVVYCFEHAQALKAAGPES
jgi:hypothetical protein